VKAIPLSDLTRQTGWEVPQRRSNERRHCVPLLRAALASRQHPAHIMPDEDILSPGRRLFPLLLQAHSLRVSYRRQEPQGKRR
jgi:hypothetical protein